MCFSISFEPSNMEAVQINAAIVLTQTPKMCRQFDAMLLSNANDETPLRPPQEHLN